MSLTSIIILLQMCIGLLSGAITTNLSQTEKDNILALSNQSMNIAIEYLKQNNTAPIVDESIKNYYVKDNISSGSLVDLVVIEEKIQKTDCSIPKDDPKRTKLNEKELERMPTELREHMNSVAQFNWYKSTYGFCL